MINSKVKLIVIAIALLIAGMGMNGCKKCYECEILHAGLKFYKQGDTINVLVATLRTANDSIEYYTNAGYECDTFKWLYRPDLVDMNPICGKEAYDRRINNGEKCEPVK